MKKTTNLAILSVARILESVLLFCVVTINARILDPNKFGVLAILLGIFAYLRHGGEFGLRSVIMARVAQMEDGILKYLKSYIVSRLVVSFIVLMGSVVFVGFKYNDSVFYSLCVFSSLIFIALQFDWILLCNGEYVKSAIITFSRPFFYLLIIILLYLGGYCGLEVVSMSFLVSWALTTCMAIWLVKNVLIKSYNSSKFEFSLMCDLVRAGFPIFVISISSQIVQNLDLLCVGKYFGLKEAGNYYIANNIAMSALVFSNSMSQIALSKMGKFFKNKKEFYEEFKQNLCLISGVGIVVGVGIYVVSPFADVVFSEKYVQAISFVRLFVPYLFVSHISSLLNSSMIAINMQNKLLVVSFFKSFSVFIVIYLSVYLNNLYLLPLLKFIPEVVGVIISFYYMYNVVKEW